MCKDIQKNVKIYAFCKNYAKLGRLNTGFKDDPINLQGRRECFAASERDFMDRNFYPASAGVGELGQLRRMNGLRGSGSVVLTDHKSINSGLLNGTGVRRSIPVLNRRVPEPGDGLLRSRECNYRLSRTPSV